MTRQLAAFARQLVKSPAAHKLGQRFILMDAHIAQLYLQLQLQPQPQPQLQLQSWSVSMSQLLLLFLVLLPA